MGSPFSKKDSKNQEDTPPEMEASSSSSSSTEDVSTHYILHLLDQVRKKKFEYLSFQAFKLRVLIDWILPFFQFTLQDLYTLKEKIYIHPECSEAIHHLLMTTTLSPKDQMILQYIMSQDYHDAEIVKEFCPLLNRIGSSSMEMKHALDRIFALDGDLNGYENYIHHLKYPLKTTTPKDVLGNHVYTIRKQLYDDSVQKGENTSG